MNAVALVAALIAVPWVGFPKLATWPILIVATVLHSGYKLSLAKIYLLEDLSKAYPLARGLTPLFATVLAFVLLGETPGLRQMAGLALIVAGLLTLRSERAELRLSSGALAYAAVVGLSVSLYTVVDAYGLRISGDWATFTVWLIIVDASAFVALSRLLLGTRIWADWRSDPLRIAGAGLLGMLTFCVFIWALGRAPIGTVAALRETSVLFAALIGCAYLKEPLSTARIASAVLIFFGIVVVAAS
jgi:drug/metabolite transporter (DMT)-like permease